LATLRRWVRVGVCGIRVRVFANGGTGVCTTVEELQRFIRTLSSIRGLD
jgi:hypothetical protein